MAPRLNSSTVRGSEILYGRNAVIEALHGRRRHRHLFVSRGAERQERVAQLLRDAAVLRLPVVRLQAGEFDQIAGDVNHQGVALETSPYPYTDLEDLVADPAKRPIVFLDHLQDPQNLGTLLRTADATGVGGLVIPDRRSASITPAVVNTSAGAVEHLNVARVTNLARAIEMCKETGYWIAALEHSADAGLLFTSDIPEPTGLLIGSEGKGIAPSLMSHCDLVVQIPMVGQVASLNAAIAGSIALYELLRRRLKAG